MGWGLGGGGGVRTCIADRTSNPLIRSGPSCLSSSWEQGGCGHGRLILGWGHCEARNLSVSPTSPRRPPVLGQENKARRVGRGFLGQDLRAMLLRFKC